MTHTFVPETPDWVKPILIREAERTGVPAILLSAQILQESGFNPNVGSVAGARGISQFIASTARSYGLRVDSQVDERLDPDKSIRAQADMMRDLINSYGTVERALSAYNSGSPDKYLNPNFRTWYGSVGETHNYVKNITNKAGVYGNINLEENIKPQKQPDKNILGELAKEPEVKESYYKPSEITVIPQDYIRVLTEPFAPIPKIRPDQQMPQSTPQSTQRKEADQQNLSLTRYQPAQQPAFTSFKQPSQIPSMDAKITAQKIAPSPSMINRNYATSQMAGRNYTVKAGDTLWAIAQRQLGSGNRWKELGYQGNPRTMPIGTVLKF